MKQQYLDTLMPSFRLWLDHEILSRGEAFVNYSGSLYQTTDGNFSQNKIWGGPFRQWVSDTSITGANIPQSVIYNGNSINKGGAIGLNIDYGRGRIITNSSAIDGSSFSASYAFKELNIYYTDTEEERLLFDSNFKLRPRNSAEANATKVLEPNDSPVPCIFVKLRDSTNEPFSFGGLDYTSTEIRTIIIADSNYLLDSTLSIMNDSVRKVFPLFSASELPFNVFGDYKSGVYNYNTLAGGVTYPNIITIDKVLVSKFNYDVSRLVGKGFYTAMADFRLWHARTPRIYN